MDKIDQTIINEMQKNARVSLKQLAEKCFISSPAVSARISHLEKEGILRGYQAVMNLTKAGFPIKAFISVQLEPTREPDFYQFCAQNPQVLQCDCVTGDYSQLMQVAFDSTTALDHFVNRVSRYGKTSTQIVFSTSVERRGLTLPTE